MDAAHDIAQHRQNFTEANTSTLICPESNPDFQDGASEINKNVLDAKEVAIQANDYEIERKFSHLPARKRYIPLKFSDYRVFDGSSQAESKREEQEEEAEEETDSTFKPTKDVERKTRKPARRRGRPRKNSNAIVSDDGTASGSQEAEIDGKAAIIKVAAGFKCSLCSRIFTLRGNAKSHLITHTDKKPFSCDFEGCGKSLRTKEALRRHQLSHLGIKMFECTVCHKKLSTNISLQEHMTVHSGEKPLICPVCGRKFRQKAVLKRHIITHSEDKPYACTVCDKKFSMKVYVKSHMKTHTGERPFTCEICTKSFAHASDLKRHKIIHTGEKPYACSICPMRYNDVSSRKRHEREHQTGQQYLCSLCNQRFSRAGHLRSHLVRAHNMGSNGLYEVHTVDKEAQESWPPGTRQPKYVSLLPSSQDVNLAAQKGQAGKENGGDKDPQTGQILVGAANASLNELKASSAENTSDLTNAKGNRSEDNIELSVFDPALERLDTLQPGFTYKIIDHPNSNNILEFRLEESESVQHGNSAGLNLGDITGETSLTVIKDENSDTLMVIQQAPGQTAEQQHHPSETEIDPASSACAGQWQVHLGDNLSGIHTEARQAHTALQQDTRQEKALVPQSDIDLESTSLNNDNMIKVEDGLKNINDSKNDPSNILTSKKDGVADSTQLGTSLMEVEAVSDDSMKYIYHPDLTSQDYYNWLSAFTEECKALALPLQKNMFQRISHVHKTLTDFMASPTGVITDKNNFKVLMSITKDLSDIVSNHLMLMYQNLV